MMLQPYQLVCFLLAASANVKQSEEKQRCQQTADNYFNNLIVPATLMQELGALPSTITSQQAAQAMAVRFMNTYSPQCQLQSKKEALAKGFPIQVHGRQQDFYKNQLPENTIFLEKKFTPLEDTSSEINYIAYDNTTIDDSKRKAIEKYLEWPNRARRTMIENMLGQGEGISEGDRWGYIAKKTHDLIPASLIDLYFDARQKDGILSPEQADSMKVFVNETFLASVEDPLDAYSFGTFNPEKHDEIDKVYYLPNTINQDSETLSNRKNVSRKLAEFFENIFKSRPPAEITMFKPNQVKALVAPLQHNKIEERCYHLTDQETLCEGKGSNLKSMMYLFTGYGQAMTSEGGVFVPQQKPSTDEASTIQEIAKHVMKLESEQEKTRVTVGSSGWQRKIYSQNDGIATRPLS